MTLEKLIKSGLFGVELPQELIKRDIQALITSLQETQQLPESFQADLTPRQISNLILSILNNSIKQDPLNVSLIANFFGSREVLNGLTPSLLIKVEVSASKVALTYYQSKNEACIWYSRKDDTKMNVTISGNWFRKIFDFINLN